MAAIIPGNGKTDLGKTGTPWTNGYFDNLYKGGNAVVTTNDNRLVTTDQKAACAGSAGSPSSTNKFLTQADLTRVRFLVGVTGTYGGSAAYLNAVTTVGLTAGMLAMFVDTNGGSPLVRMYELVTQDPSPGSPPDYVQPNDHATSGFIWVLRTAALPPSAPDFIFGGDDPIDADKLVIDFTPANYTRNDTPAEVDDLTQLSSHLNGIDLKLASVLTTRTGVYRTLTKSAHEFMVGTGSPAIGSITYGSINLQTAGLTNAAIMSVRVAFRLPDEWDTSAPLKFKLEWSGDTTPSTPGTNDAVLWAVSGRLFADSSDLTAALGTAHTFTDVLTAIKYTQLTGGFSPTLAGSGRLCVLDVQRTFNDTSDTYTGVAYLTAVQCQYKESATEPSVW